MNQCTTLVAVGAGGAIGSLLRYVIGSWFIARISPAFPWGTFFINVSGAFLIGCVLETANTKIGLNPSLRAFLATGVLGGYTTFSTFAFETAILSKDSFNPASIWYPLASVMLGVLAVSCGIALIRHLIPR